MKSIATLAILSITTMSGCGFSIVEPGHRGVKVSLGEVSPHGLSEGLHWHAPFITSIKEISVRQATKEVSSDCYSLDLQQVTIKLSVLYRIPESSIVSIFQEYSGDVFDSLIAPRVHEAVKEVVAQESAESLMKNREKIKSLVLENVKKKIGSLIFIEDLSVSNIDLSDELEKAIEQKMVQEQEAAKAKFTQQKAEIEARTLVIKAQGEAEAMQIRGDVIKNNPKLIDLQIAEKWNGVAPLVIGGGGTNVLLPLQK